MVKLVDEEEAQAVSNHLDELYEEECHNRVHPAALAAVGFLILYIVIFIASILYYIFG